jgi:glycosyltransferase involved in cell wall biosynthesis
VSQRWHILSGEYPPQPGGVADYTRSVARGLAATGAEVHVWSSAGAETADDEGVCVHRLAGCFGPAALRKLDAALACQPGRVLLQYTPHAFGYKAMNVPLCAWLSRRRRLDVMFHEVAFPFVRGQPWKHHLLAAVNRGMAALLLQAAERVFVSVPSWESILRRLTRRRVHPIWAPVPSNLPTECDAAAVASVRGRLLRGQRRLVGHFGTYGPLVGDLLEPALRTLLAGPGIAMLLLGRGGPAYAAGLIERCPELATRVIAPGELAATDAAEHVAACDVMLQPYPDGVSARRGTAMAALALGRPVVSTHGVATEPVWRQAAGVDFAASADLGDAVIRLLASDQRRDELGRRAAALYREHFALEHTIRLLLEPVQRPARLLQA